MDMDGSKLKNGLMVGMWILIGLVGLTGTFFFGIVLINIVLGFLFGVTSTLGVPNATAEFNNNISRSFFGFANYILDGLGIIGSLITLVIVLIVLGGLVYVGYKGYKGMKDKKSEGDY